jgi:hypothetical protein
MSRTEVPVFLQEPHPCDRRDPSPGGKSDAITQDKILWERTILTRAKIAFPRHLGHRGRSYAPRRLGDSVEDDTGFRKKQEYCDSRVPSVIYFALEGSG